MTKSPISFGTDGWRGIVADDFTYENVRRVAQGTAAYLKDDKRPIVIGHDTRFSAEHFAAEVARVLAANENHVLLMDRPFPTPGASWTVVDRKAAGAVVVTASHNPAEFNGLKFKPDYGGSALPEVTDKIEKETHHAEAKGVKAMDFDLAVKNGQVEYIDPQPSYFAQLARLIDVPKIQNAGLRILHECMYGTAAGCLAFVSGGKTSIDELHAERNPGFGGTHPEPIAEYMPDTLKIMGNGKYDLCIANDCDADRLGIIDETGRFLNQLQVMALLCMYLLEKRGERGAIVRNIASTSMADQLGKMFDVPVYELPVGFKFIGEKMRETNALIGGEESGGFAFRGHIPERDGILAGMYVASMVVDYGMPLSKILTHLEDLVGPHAYSRDDIHIDRNTYQEKRAVMYKKLKEHEPKELAGFEIVRVRDDDGFKYYTKDGSWVLIRFSGTEPLIRVYSEAPDQPTVENLIHALEEYVGLQAPTPVGATS